MSQRPLSPTQLNELEIWRLTDWKDARRAINDPTMRALERHGLAEWIEPGSWVQHGRWRITEAGKVLAEASAEDLGIKQMETAR